MSPATLLRLVLVVARILQMADTGLANGCLPCFPSQQERPSLLGNLELGDALNALITLMIIDRDSEMSPSIPCRS